MAAAPTVDGLNVVVCQGGAFFTREVVLTDQGAGGLVSEATEIQRRQESIEEG